MAEAERGSQPTDADLVLAARAGESAAYEELVARYQGHVYGLAYSMLQSWSEAQDITQETFIRVYANLDQLREPARFAPWLRRVTFSVTMNWLRAHRPEVWKQLGGQVDLETLEVPDFAPGPSEVVERRELSRAVMRAVATLPPRYRVPLTMFHLDGLSYQKVADFLDIPLGTAKSLIHRARAMIRPALGAYLEEEVNPMVKEVFDEHRLPPDFARNVIAGLEEARWGGGERANSSMGALAAALEQIGAEIPYHFLMGVSGGAFRIQVAQPGWCPSAPHANCGYTLYPALRAALPYEVVPVGADQDDSAPGRRAPQALVDSIDQGVPAFYAREEKSLVVGYDKRASQVVLRSYNARAPGYETRSVDDLLSSWGGFEVLKAKTTVPDRRASLIRSLEIALELARTPMFPDPTKEGGYASGFAAYEAWIAGLLDGEPRDFQATLGNGHTFRCLIDARRCAARYLDEIAAELGAAEPPLRRAAERYREVEAILKREDANVIAPMPWMPTAKQWSDAERRKEAELLRAALEVERKAIEDIEEALAVLRN